jgi:thiamine biosynthesis lipoprotein
VVGLTGLLLLVAATRESRVAAGTVVGVTVRDRPEAIPAAYAAIERFEAELSEWRPDSAVARANATGEPVALSPASRHLFRVAKRVERRSDGAFRLAWRGGDWRLGRRGLTATGPLGLGGILKGFLVDRAADALIEAGARDFVVDAAGDVVAGPGGVWEVEVPALGRVIALRDRALSTSGEEQQPGHIVDARTGVPVTCSRAAVVVATEGVWADALATALYASCGETRLPAGAQGWWVAAREAPPGFPGEARELSTGAVP